MRIKYVVKCEKNSIRSIRIVDCRCDGNAFLYCTQKYYVQYVVRKKKTLDRRMFVYTCIILLYNERHGNRFFENVVYCEQWVVKVYSAYPRTYTPTRVKYTFYAVRTRTKGIFEFPVCSTCAVCQEESSVLIMIFFNLRCTTGFCDIM